MTERLHDAFLAAISKAITNSVVDLIAKKAADKGVVLTPSDRQQVFEKIENDGHGEILLEERPEGRIQIALDEADLAGLEATQASIIRLVPELLEEEASTLASQLLVTLKQRWATEEQRQALSRVDFESRLRSRWEEPLRLLSMTLTIAREFSETVGTRLQKNDPSSALVAALVRLHARACQVAAEVLVLLEAGFADGAMARWRTLHEIAVVMMYLRQEGEAVAEKYLLYEHVESARAAPEYQDHHVRLGTNALEQEALDATRRESDDLKTRFGKSFGGNCGWAASPANQSPNFADIEAGLKLDHWRPYYRLASHNVHANPKGVAHRLGLPKGRRVLALGPSIFGLADPGQNTALSLLQSSAALGATHEPTLDGLVTLKILMALSDEVGQAFVRLHKQMETAAASEGEPPTAKS